MSQEYLEHSKEGNLGSPNTYCYGWCVDTVLGEEGKDFAFFEGEGGGDLEEGTEGLGGVEEGGVGVLAGGEGVEVDY